jgi:hypothetical protein
VHAKSPGRALHGIVSATFSDPTNERLIYMAAAGLVIVGVALLVGTILWWHRGRQEHPALAPLEVMGSHGWEKAPEGERRRILNSVRINGEPVSDAEVVRPDAVDLQALVRSVPQAFDDLREPGVADAAVEEAPHLFEVNASGDIELVDASAESVAEPVSEAIEEPAVEPIVEGKADRPAEVAVPVEVDATKFAAERPQEPVETLAAVPTEPSR